ncbi:MAG: methionyl-tRNA formyltransferase [Candidatus Omnitrophota bacterium]|nr:methionyl-tRNA formyltransferase [Candidatus Omnitrophota bacterium]
MEIIFFGSSNFAVSILEAIISSGYELACVVTQPDRKAGRHLKIALTPVKSYCQTHNISIFQPEDLKAEEVRGYLKKFVADLFIVVSYGKIIPKEILDLPKIFSVNIHTSLLPKYRGAAPINRAIMNGEKETGISIIRMNEFMDRGDIILQKPVALSDEFDAQSLSASLAEAAKEAIIEAIGLIKNKKYSLRKQSEQEATYASKLTKEDGVIDWGKSRKVIFNQVRGLVPWPGAYTYLSGKILKVWQAHYTDFNKPEGSGLASFSQSRNLKPGRIPKIGEVINITGEGIIVCCGSGFLFLKEVQPASGKRMSAYDFAMGHRIKKGDRLG